MTYIECGVCGSIIGRADTPASAQAVMKEHRQDCSLASGWFK